MQPATLSDCDAFWAAEPLNQGNVFGRVEITRWRYGKSLG